MVVVSTGHVDGTLGSGIVSCAADVLWMRLVHRMTEVGGVYDMSMCLTRAAWVERG